MLYFSSLCKFILDSWVTASESFDALHHHFNSCKYECFWPRKEQVWGERRDDVTSMHELNHICKQNLLFLFPDTGQPADNLRFFLCWSLRALKKIDSGDVCISLAKQPYIVSVDNVPLKLRGFGFDVFCLYVSLLNVSLPSYILPLLHT